MNKIYHTTAVFNGKHFVHFGVQEMMASLYGDNPDSILQIEFKIHDEQIKPKHNEENNKLEPDYWGYLRAAEEDFSLIYPKYFLLNMCFPYGIDILEEKGHGKAYRLKITEVKLKNGSIYGNFVQ